MPTVSAARGCSPTERSRSPRGVRNRKIVSSDDEDQRDPRQRVRVADRVAEERQVLDPGDADVGDPRDVVGRALVAVVVEEDVAGDAEGQEVQPNAADDLVGAQVDREERVHEGERAARGHADEQAQEPRVEQVGAEDPEERAHEHHALQADVHDAAALGHDPAQGGEEQRRGVAQRRGDQRRPRHHVLEVVDPRLRRGHGAGTADEARRNGAPAHAFLTAADRPRAGGHRQQPDEDRRHRRAHQGRWQRDEPRDEPERDAAPARVARIDRARRRRGGDRRAHREGSLSDEAETMGEQWRAVTTPSPPRAVPSSSRRGGTSRARGAAWSPR